MSWTISLIIFLATTLLASKFHPRQTGSFSWHRFLPIYYLIFFGAVPIIEQLTGAKDFNSTPGVSDAYLILSLGIFSFWLGGWYSFIATKNIKPIYLTEIRPFSYLYNKEFILATLIIGVISLLITILRGNFGLISSTGLEVEESSHSNLVSTLASLVNITLLVSWWIKSSNTNKDRFWNKIAYASLTATFISGLLSNSKSAIIIPIIYIAIISYIHGWRPRISHIIFGASFVFLFVFPFVYFSRTALVSEAAGMSRSEYIEYVLEFLATGAWSRPELLQLVADDAIGSLGRNLLTVMSTIVETTGRDVPYLNGETYQIALGVSIPRLIWPDKPDLNIGNLIGHHYGLIRDTDMLTNISPSQPGEMYMNFGVLAVIIGMQLWGIFATLLYKIYGSHSWMTPSLLMMTTWQEGHTTPLILWPRNLLFLMVALFLIHTIVSITKTRKKTTKTHNEITQASR